MNIIVTGGAGFIGSNFIFTCSTNTRTTGSSALDCLTYAGNLSTLAPVMDNPNFRFVKESITDRKAVYRLFEEEHPDMVVNFCGRKPCRSFHRKSAGIPRNQHYWNFRPMDACRNTGSRDIIKFLLMRSTEIFHLTGRIFSSQRKRRSTQVVHTAPRRLPPTCSSLPTTALTDFQ